MRPNCLNNLAVALPDRFDHLGQYGDLEEAISFHREALQLRPVSHPDRLHNVAMALKKRFTQSGECQNPDEAISLRY